jgi:hypothetical protein
VVVEVPEVVAEVEEDKPTNLDIKKASPFKEMLF